MNIKHAPLPHRLLGKPISVHRPQQQLAQSVNLDEAATDVMTDLSQVSAITISPWASIDDANHYMISNQIRLLLVTNRDNHIQGLITSTDILGEKPIQYLKEVGGQHEDILVRDIMTPYEKLEVLQMVDVINASVSDIVETLKQVGRQHTLVVDMDHNQKQMVRGIFSSSQLGRQLGISLDSPPMAHTFAELEIALVS